MWDSKKASRICLGCVAFGGYDYGKIRKVDCINTIHAALDQGINTFDTAAIYGLGKSEEILGEALRKKREAILITKFGLFKNTNNETVRDLSPDKIPLQAEQSLRRLKRDFIDLYLIHWYDDKTPIDEVISQLVRLQKQGKIKAYGCSNFNRDLIDPIINHVHALQVPYSLGQNEYEDGLQKCHSHQQFTMAYNVLMRG
ncbi:MAG: aldo/keto reductase, partial [Puniceicoccales bacterium]|nr:aldo/keto reductase [Puniceicoccales bacterium]